MSSCLSGGMEQLAVNSEVCNQICNLPKQCYLKPSKEPTRLMTLEQIGYSKNKNKKKR